MELFHPHHVHPDDLKIRVLFFYKNFAAKQGVSHIGLGVSLQNTMMTLRKNGIWADVVPIVNPQDAAAILTKKMQEAGNHKPPLPPYSHVVFSAPWIPVEEYRKLMNQLPDVIFLNLCHSNVGFLQVDTNGVINLRNYIDLEKGSHNFHVAGNNDRFVQWIQRAYNAPCAYLPNLYNLDGHCPHRRPWDGSLLNVGIFGALRPQKNFMTAVAGAIEIYQQMRATTCLYMSSGRPENEKVIWASIQQMVKGLPGLTLINNGWETWPQFLRTVGQMDLMLQPSYSETFNIVTADGIAMGIPSVVSDAIEWAPKSWTAECDDASSISIKGCHLLQDMNAPLQGWKHLTAYVTRGVHDWKTFLRHS